MEPDYDLLVKNIKIDDSSIIELKILKQKFLNNIAIYSSVQKITSVPSELVFSLHYRESSLDFSRVLHNGEKIIGKNKKTKLVPKDRGPFETWQEAAIDALLMKKSIFPKEWSFTEQLKFSEKYNGLGYRNKVGDSGRIELSPYVFSGTNLSDETGKYVYDGKYNMHARESQLGVASILITLSGSSLPTTNRGQNG